MKPKKPKKPKKQEIVVMKPQREKMWIEVEGISEMIMHRFAAKMLLRDTHAGTPKKGKIQRTAAVIQQEYTDSLYVYERGKNGSSTIYGAKAIWFKSGMAFVAKEDKMANTVYRNIQIGETLRSHELLPIKCKKGDPHMRIGEDGLPGDIVRNANKSPDIRYRAEFFPGWRIVVPIIFNSRRVSKEQVVAWLDEAGTASGIGDWRPEKGGVCGMYKISNTKGKRDGTKR